MWIHKGYFFCQKAGVKCLQAFLYTKVICIKVTGKQDLLKGRNLYGWRIESLTFDILLHAKSVPKQKSNWFCTPIIFKPG